MQMDNTDFKVGDRVVVSATVTGTGEDMHGWITDIEFFAGHTYISITYDWPTAIGDRGTCVVNPGLITKIDSNV